MSHRLIQRIACFVPATLLAGVALSLVCASPAPETWSAANDLRVGSPKAASSAPAAPNYVESAATLRHWDKMVVRVAVNEPDPKRSLNETRTAVLRSLSLWNRHMAQTVRLELAPIGCDDAEIQVRFVRPNSLPGRAIGRTDVTFRLSDQVLLRAQVGINEGLSDAQLLQVTAHEMGHALGIQGHSPDKNDLMFPYAHTPAIVTERDLNTMYVSYGIAPPSANYFAANRTSGSKVAASLVELPDFTEGAP